MENLQKSNLNLKISSFEKLNYMRESYSKITELETYISLLWWQKKNLMYTRTGYGSKIPTSYIVRFENRYHRVYCQIFSNCGTLYIIKNNKRIILDN